jgi:hypothetical protein
LSVCLPVCFLSTGLLVCLVILCVSALLVYIFLSCLPVWLPIIVFSICLSSNLLVWLVCLATCL